MSFHCFGRLNYLSFDDLDSAKGVCNELPTQLIDTSFHYIISRPLLFQRRINILLGLSQISKMDFFLKIVNSLKPLNVWNI